MALFRYKGLNSRGQNVKGIVDADGLRGARQKLKSQGIFPTDVTEADSAEQKSKRGTSIQLFGERKVSITLVSVITRQLSTLISAGMPLVEALKALGDQIDSPRVKGVMADVTDKVNEGSTLAKALADHPKVFPKLFVNMVASGEASGSLDMVLERLAELLEAQAALRRKIVSALTYPVLMLVLCFGVIILLLAYVVPQITAIFKDQKATLPLPTQIIIVMSNFTQQYWWAVIIALVGAVILFQRYSVTKAGRRRLDGMLLKLPVLGPVTLKIATSRFARNLGTMLTSGVELLAALAIVRNIVGNVVLEEAIADASDRVREGKGLAEELARTNLFPRLLTHMIAVGERSGQLDNMLVRAAAAYESEVSAFISSITSILEPLLIVFLACIVGGILAAVMLPMLEMTSMSGV